MSAIATVLAAVACIELFSARSARIMASEDRQYNDSSGDVTLPRNIISRNPHRENVPEALELKAMAHLPVTRLV